MLFTSPLTALLLFGGPCWQGDTGGVTARPERPYTLFHPTPRSEMRPFVTDRPTTTDSPLTVDAGRYQLEVSVADWTREGRDDQFGTFQTYLRAGLTSATELQVAINAYTIEDPAAGGGEEGFGDVVLRYKWNVWGNGGEDTSFAVLPFLKIPTGTGPSNDELEGGLGLPFGGALSDSVSYGLLARFDAVYDGAENDHDLVFLHSGFLALALTGSTGAFVEYVGLAGEDDYLPSINIGVTYQPTSETLLDFGTRLGLVEEAPDLGLFIGFGVRF